MPESYREKQPVAAVRDTATNDVRLAVIVPTYGNWADCLECMSLLARQACRDFTVVLADDGSHARPPEAILALPFVTYLRLPHRGYAQTCNAAARKAIDLGASHLLLLNDDTAFGPRFIGGWIEKIREKPSAIMAPMIYYFDRPDSVWFSGGRFSAAVPFFSCRRRPSQTTPVDVLTGCALVVPCEAWQRLGGFDESFVTYYEDFDLLLRARRKRIAAYLVTDNELDVRHKVSRTTGRDGPWPREYHLIASRLRFIRRHFTGFERAFCLSLAGLHLLVTCVLNLPALPDVGRLRRAITTGMGDGPPRPAMRVEPASAMHGTRPEPTVPTVIAFHLPQFHRIPENDAWWGEGFTEWTNVRKAAPRYPGHALPAVPLGGRYYDLGDPAAREWQADLARRHGVGGFCYYHYWFTGKRLLERPCEEILASGRPDFPFCFSWANESWTRSWDGSNRSVLIRQDYGTESDWKAHFEYLLPFFRDRRYITRDGRPLFLIYRPADFPAVDRMMTCWNRWASQEGLPGICFVKTLTCFDARPPQPPFTAAASFEPWLAERRHSRLTGRLTKLARRAVHRVARSCGLGWTFVLSYDVIWQDILRRTHGSDDFPGAFVGWDNTPRMGDRSRIVAGATPEKFGHFMRQLLANAVRDGAPFVFVNAWNEWAEGAYLEPDERHGHAYLEQLAAVIEACRSDLRLGDACRPADAEGTPE